MAKSLLLILNIRGLLCFSGVILTVEFTKSMSLHLSFQASPARIAVSFSIWGSAAVFSPHPAISWSISCSVGMNGIFWILRYLGWSHLPPIIFRKLL